MFESLRLSYRARRLRRYHRRQARKAERLPWKDAERRLDQLHAEWESEYIPIEEEQRLRLEGKLKRTAERFLIPLPPYRPDRYEPSRLGGRVLLKKEAVQDLYTEVQKARKLRNEVWLPWLGALTGLIGALTGLAAVIFRSK